MRIELTLDIDEDLAARVEEYLRSRGISLPALIERQLQDQFPVVEAGKFSERWRGKFARRGREDDRYAALGRKYL